MRVSNDVLFDAQVVADSSTENSEAVDLKHIYGYAVYASWSGTSITGSIKLQGSADGGVTFADLASLEETINSDSGSVLWNVPDAMYDSFRVVCTSTANAITVTAKFHAKGV
jgi:hypothetical protein